MNNPTKHFKTKDWIGLVLCIGSITFVLTFLSNNILEYMRIHQKEETRVSYVVKAVGNKITVEQVERP